MRTAPLRLLLVLLALAPTACRAPVAPLGYLPLVPGARWVYEVRSSRGRGELEVEAVGDVMLPGRSGSVFLMRETRRQGDGPGQTTAVGYVVEEGFVAQLIGLGYDGDGRLQVLGQDRALRVLPLHPRPGQRWSQPVRLFTAAGEPGGLMIWEAEVHAGERISVPAGEFDEVVRVESISRDESGSVVMTYRDVYARGVGLVHSTAAPPTGRPARAVEHSLLHYAPSGDRPPE